MSETAIPSGVGGIAIPATADWPCRQTNHLCHCTPRDYNGGGSLRSCPAAYPPHASGPSAPREFTRKPPMGRDNGDRTSPD
jgi:hypothetical protein